MTPNEQLIENTKKACNVVLDDYHAGKITVEVMYQKMKKLSENWNRYEKNNENN